MNKSINNFLKLIFTRFNELSTIRDQRSRYCKACQMYLLNTLIVRGLEVTFDLN